MMTGRDLPELSRGRRPAVRAGLCVRAKDAGASRICQYGVLAAFALFAVSVNAVAASAWNPSRNVEIVAGTNPGGAADHTARTVQRLMQERNLVGAVVVVANRPGAGGALGWTYINQRPGDGHYLAIATPPLVTNHITGRSPLHHSELTPVVQLFGENFAFVVRADSPIRNGGDLMRQWKAAPESVGIAVASTGGANHIAIALVAKKAGIDVRRLRVVVFNSGSETITALLGGHVQLVAANPSSASRLVESGSLRAIALAGEKRLSGTYAEVPTWREQGVDAVLTAWRGIVGPRGLGAPEVAYWEQVFEQLTRSEDWKEDLRKRHWQDNFIKSAAARKFLDAEYAELKSVLGDLGLAKQ